MSQPLAARLHDAVADTALAERLPAAAAPLLEHRADDASLARMDEDLLRGLARSVAAHPDTAIFLSHRPALLERLTDTPAGGLAALREALTRFEPSAGDDLELALDELRLLRREGTCIAACLQQAGRADFAEVSDYLSSLAETILEIALDLASRSVGADTEPLAFAVVGMGKIAGREFTFHSDLDLLFLCDGGPETVAKASRVGQRLISYLSTMTGAGIAYAVDTRLRPSGRQGMLVTTLPAFERYQCEQAQTWEHVAMLRARAVAGAVAPARETLERVRKRVLTDHPPPWDELVGIRGRVEDERMGRETESIPFKTSAGCLMDVDFLAGGGLLERRTDGLPPLPSVPALLCAAARGARVERVLEAYAFLRRVEAAARWMAGRAVEAIDDREGALAVTAELTEPGLDADGLRQRIAAARSQIRAAWDAVIAAGSIAALDD